MTHTHIYTYNTYVYTFDGRHIFRNPLVDTVFNIPWSTEIIYEKLSWFTEVHSWRISCRLEITWLFVKATLMRKPKDDFEIPGMLINSCRHPCDQDLLWYLVACHVLFLWEKFLCLSYFCCLFFHHSFHPFWKFLDHGPNSTPGFFPAAKHQQNIQNLRG